MITVRGLPLKGTASVRPSIQKRHFLSGGKSPDQSYVVRRRMNHPQQIVYKVVEDVASYKDFIPFCKDSFINQTNELGNPTEAGLRVGWKSFDETFVCKLTCSDNSKVVAESSTAALFKHLYSAWDIKESTRKDTCEVELTLKYSFHNPLYNSVSSLLNEKVTNVMIKAFDKRASEIRRQLSKDIANEKVNL